ncbi:MAG TPA: sialidase family protein, partial [Verrucomicrobiae bacterium]|nr:sialidase family protein [Verrucomicrobiae bacterium]
FGGSREGARDVVIWLSRNEGKGWSKPEEVANGVHDEDRIQYACWNPVLFRPDGGPLLLFYKEGPDPSEWWGMVKSSDDNGKTWSRARRLPSGIYGPIRNKPVEFDDKTILCGSSTEDQGWRIHLERTKRPLSDQAWARTAALNRSVDFAAIQPTIIPWAEDNIQILCRTKNEAITECWSGDKGQTWTRMKATELPNPNSAIDAVLLKDKRALLVYNHTTEGRGVLNVALSPNGRDWQAALVLENTPGSEFSYPAIIQTADRLVHITYTWNRERIRHVVIDPSKLSPHPMVNGEWPW